MKKPLYNLFKTPTKYYIYDTISDKNISITSNLYEELNSKEFSVDLNDMAKKEVEEIREYGFLKPNPIEKIAHPDEDVLELKLRRQLSSITLQITQQCNLRCKYCAYSGSYTNRVHSGKTMKLETAIACLDFLKNNSQDSDSINIGLYGGEPLLHFDLIKDIVNYSRKIFDGKKLSFFVTTNGTLFSDEIIKFFSEQNVYTTISLDGSENSHDRNRVFANNSKGTFNVIIKEITRIKKQYPEYFEKINFNVVLDQNEDYKETNDYFQYNSLFENSNITVSVISNEYRNEKIQTSEIFEIQWRTELYKVFMANLGRISKKDVSNLFEQYISNIDNRMCNRITSDLGNTTTHSGPCVPAVNKLFVNVDGVFYPCEKVNEESEVMLIGDVSNGINLEKTLVLLNVGNITEKACKNCWAIRHCNSCVIMADGGDALSESLKLKRCKEIKNNVEILFKNYFMLKELGYDSDAKFFDIEGESK